MDELWTAVVSPWYEAAASGKPVFAEARWHFAFKPDPETEGLGSGAAVGRLEARRVEVGKDWGAPPSWVTRLPPPPIASTTTLVRSYRLEGTLNHPDPFVGQSDDLQFHEIKLSIDALEGWPTMTTTIAHPGDSEHSATFHGGQKLPDSDGQGFWQFWTYGF